MSGQPLNSAAVLRAFFQSLNWKEIDLILSELALPGSLVQEVHQPGHDRFVLDLFQRGRRFSILVSLSPRFPRLHAFTEKPVNPAKPPRFASFLRAHIKGGRIEAAEQVAGERIVRIAVRRGDEEKVLWIRLWGSAANAIVTEAQGRILDAFHRRPKRNEISGKAFDPLAATAGRRPGASDRDYEVRDLPGAGTFNQRVEIFFREAETSGDTERLAASAEAELSISESKLLTSIDTLAARLSEYGNLERFRELGDLVTSNLHAISRGDRWVKVEDFFHDNAPVEIELRPELTPAQNAEVYYDRHRKAKLGRDKVEAEMKRLTAALEDIRSQRAALQANPEPALLLRATRTAVRARRQLSEPDAPGLVFSSPPFRIIVGRTSSENDELLRRKVRGNDWWFHARDWPGAYVFVKAQPGKSLPLDTMIDAATLAIHFSKGRNSGQGDVYYTRVKHLRRAKGAKKGTVLPTQEKNLHVRLDPARIERLKETTSRVFTDRGALL